MTDRKSSRNIIPAGMKSANDNEAKMLLPEIENQTQRRLYNHRMKLGGMSHEPVLTLLQ